MDFEGRNSKFKYLSHWHTSGLSSWHGQSRTNCASTFTQRAATTLMFINNIVCKKHTLREKRGGPAWISQHLYHGNHQWIISKYLRTICRYLQLVPYSHPVILIRIPYYSNPPDMVNLCTLINMNHYLNIWI